MCLRCVRVVVRYFDMCSDLIACVVWQACVYYKRLKNYYDVEFGSNTFTHASWFYYEHASSDADALVTGLNFLYAGAVVAQAGTELMLGIGLASPMVVSQLTDIYATSLMQMVKVRLRFRTMS